jgi:hypothetical protein
LALFWRAVFFATVFVARLLAARLAFFFALAVAISRAVMGLLLDWAPRAASVNFSKMVFTILFL